MSEWVHKVNRVSKAVGAAIPGVALAVASVASETTGVTEDGIVSVNEWYLVLFAVVSAMGAYFAPRNTDPV